jgi:hypothetical protein
LGLKNFLHQEWNAEEGQDILKNKEWEKENYRKSEMGNTVKKKVLNELINKKNKIRL